MEQPRRRSSLAVFVQRLLEVAAVARAQYTALRERRGDPTPPPPSGVVADGVNPSAVKARRPVAEATPRRERGERAPAAPQDVSPPASPTPQLWGAEGSGERLTKGVRDPDPPRGAWQVLKELFRRFGEDQGPIYAAALAFFSLLSTIPLLVVAVAALAFLFQDPHEALLRLQNVIAGILPGSAAGKTAREIMAQADVERSVSTLIETRGIAGVIGLVSLIWASMQIFVNAAPAMNAAFDAKESRGWLRLRLVALGLLVGAGALFLLSLLPSSGPDFVRRLNIPWLGLPEHVPWYVDLFFALIALAINVCMFALIYRFLPGRGPTWRQAFVGGAVAGVLWEAAKQGFSYYLANFGNYDKVYGTLGGLVVLVLWIYYTSMILLLGAEAASLYRDLQARRRAAKGSTPLKSQAGARAPVPR